MYKPKYKGIAGDDGKVLLDQGHKEAYAATIRKLKGKRIEITVCAEERPNTRPQQRYFRAVIVPCLAECYGEKDLQAAYEDIKAQFFIYERPDGKKYVRSTELGEWTTIEWENKMDEIRHWALEFHNCKIPLPNEADY